MSRTCSPEGTGRLAPRGGTRIRQQGLSLVESLIGLTIGLMVIAAALATLLLSRGASVSISELSQLQQQGSYALRMIGVQLRQAGSLDLAPTAAGRFAFNGSFVGFGGGPTVVSGTDGAGSASDQVSVSNQPSTELASHRRDCLGTEVHAGDRIDSTFFVRNEQLYCRGLAPQAQAIIGNVADFQVAYRVRTASGTQAMTATEVAQAQAWSSVSAIEICLDLQGNEGGSPVAGTYLTCRRDSNGALASAQRAGRIHLIYRNVFDLRTQGLR